MSPSCSVRAARMKAAISPRVQGLIDQIENRCCCRLAVIRLPRDALPRLEPKCLNFRHCESSQRSRDGLEGIAELGKLRLRRRVWRRTDPNRSLCRSRPRILHRSVFEAELTFEVKGDDGKPVRFGSVGGGGRYDDLVARFTGEKVPATGFSIGVSRLQAALH